MKKVLIILAMFVLLGAVYVSNDVIAQNSEQENHNSADFKDKIVVLVTLTTQRSGEFLKNPVIQKLGDRYFITGSSFERPRETAESWENWREGSTAWIAWDTVTSFYVYTPDKFEHYLKALSELEEE